MKHEWPELVDGEFELSAEAERLWRQAAPAYLEQDGTLSYLVFRPMSNDDRKLSVSRDTEVTAKEAYDNHVESGRPSLGTLGVQVGDVRDHAGLRSVDDSGTSDDVPEGHAYIDFRPLTKQQTNTASELLLRRALANGWSYRPG